MSSKVEENMLIGKKGISEMIGYVLLVTIALVMGAIVFAWLKSYVPSETLACPDGVSLSISDYKYDCKGNLNLTIENTGRFAVAGYFIRAANKTGQELDTIDMTNYVNKTLSGGGQSQALNGWISFYGTTDNSFIPDKIVYQVFNFRQAFGNLTSIEIMAARYQTVNNKDRFVTCTDSRIKQEFVC